MSPEMLTDLQALMPEIWLVAAIVVTLTADLILGHGRTARTVTGVVALAGVVGALLALGEQDTSVPARAFGVLSVDGYAWFFRALIISATGLVILYGIIFRGLEDRTRNEFHPMLLGAAFGGCLLVSTDNLLMLVLGMEMLSLPSYIMAGWQKRERRSAEAALKYLVYGALASGLMLFGFSLLYGMSGSLWLPDIGLAITEQWELGGELGRMLVVGSTVLVFAGIGFKVAAFPFHFWAPDVYEGSPAPVTAMLAVASKAAGIGLLLRFVDGAFLGMVVSEDWLARLGSVTAVIAAVTMTYGNITAVKQTNVKRLLAYSSIAHAGFLLMGVAVMLTATGDDRAAVETGQQATLMYLATYYFGTLGAFGCLMALADRFGAEDLDDYEGLGRQAPWIGVMFVVFLASLTGLPPTAGFVGKWFVFRAAISSGLDWLAVVAALNAAVALFYYMKIPVSLFLRGGDQPRVADVPGLGLVPRVANLSILVLAAATVWLGLMFDDLIAWVNASLL